MTTERQHKAPSAGLTGTVDHQDAGDGWLLVRLMTKQALLREGLHMDHCLQDGCYQEYAGEEKLTGDAIWSLRDPAGVSWATVEVRASRVIMANGPGNRDVRRSAARRLQALVTAFRAAGRDLDFNGETDLVMADDGRVMREDQAPADVREQSRARHVARVVKLQKPQGEGLREPMQLSRDEWRVLTLDTQDAFLRYGVGIPWSEEPLTSDRVAVEDVEQARGMADALRGCQQELREGVTSALTRPRSDPLAFFDAVGAAMGLDPQAVREAQPAPQDCTFTVSARNLRARLGEVPGHGQYVLVPSTPIKDFLARQLRVGPTD